MWLNIVCQVALVLILHSVYICSNWMKIWFQNRRSKYKKMMKATQVPGDTNNNGTPGGHSGLLDANSNLPLTSPRP